jgi:Ca2+-binding RTX toxin-like protein
MAFQALALVGAQAASAAIVSCSFGGGTLTVNVSGGTTTFSAEADGDITLNGVVTDPNCTSIPAGKATLANTTAIAVNGTAVNETVVIDLLVNWGTINWTIDLGAQGAVLPGDIVELDGGAASATTDLAVSVGASGIDLDDDGDLDATVANVERIDIVGGAGDDYLCGGGSTITGGPTTVAMNVNGGAGYDDLCGGLGSDTITAGADGAAADYLLFTGPITATLGAPGTVTGAGTDTLVNIDDIYGSQGNDTITGDADYNDIAGGPGDDKINGGSGTEADLADFWDSAEAVTVDLAANTATGNGNDTITNMEDVFGSDFNDSIAGAKDEDNFIDGSAGVDWIDYSAYSTDVRVSLGDLSVPPDGDATDDANECDGDVSEECDLLDRVENAILGSADDTFSGSPFNNVVNPGGGQNVLDGLGGGDMLDYSGYEEGVNVNLAGGGVAGDSATSFENVKGSDFVDTITGGVESNTVRSGKGNDNVKGGSGDDTLRLGPGNDRARGGSGDDDLYGAKGKDALFGGGGTDLCKGGPGKDTKKGCELGGKN